MTRAKSMAEKQLGSDYRLHVSSLRNPSHGGAESVADVVNAWNDGELEDVPVHWDEKRD
jgi:hypothetical protein